MDQGVGRFAVAVGAGVLGGGHLEGLGVDSDDIEVIALSDWQEGSSVCLPINPFWRVADKLFFRNYPLKTDSCPPRREEGVLDPT